MGFRKCVYINQIIVFGIVFFSLIFHLNCSNSISDTGGGIEAGNSILAIQVINATELLTVEILPNSYFAADDEIDSFSIIDSFNGSTIKEIVLNPDIYTLLVTDSSNGKKCLVKDVVILEKGKNVVTCSLTTDGNLHLINTENEWTSGTYLFIPGTSLQYNLNEKTDSISWQLPAFQIDSIFIVYSGNSDSIEVLTINTKIVSDKITTFKKIEPEVIVNSSSQRFSKITIDKEYQNIWIGCTPDGDNSDNLLEYNKTTKVWNGYNNTDASQLSKGVTAINSNRDGTIYAGTPDGIVMSDDNVFSYYKAMNDDTNNVRNIIIDSSDTVWTVYSSFVSKGNATFNKNILDGRTLVLTPLSEIWIGTDYHGIYRLDNSLNLISQFTMNNSNLINDSIIGSCIDNNGVLWFSTPKGLACFDLNNWSNYEQFSGNFKVTEIKCNALTGDVWFITNDNKLYNIKNGELTQVEFGFDKLNNNSELVDFAIADNSSIWLLIKNAGVLKITL